MSSINLETAVTPISVEIDGVEYNIAKRTPKVENARHDLEKKARKEDWMVYKFQLADLEILLGQKAIKAIFKDGDDEDLDRMSAIYYGVLNAYGLNDRNARNMIRQKTSEDAKQCGDLLSAILRVVDATGKLNNGTTKTIHRPE